MRQKTTLYALISLLLTAVIVCGGVWFNHRFPLLPENGSLAGMDLSHAVTLTGWTQTSPGQWRVQFTDAPADAEWVVCFPGRTRRVQPEALEPMERSEEFFRLPEGASEITVRAPSVPRAWLMPAGTAWRWLDLRSSLQLVTLAAFVSMGAGILALFCFKPQYELGYFLLYLGIMFGWGLSVYLHPLTTSTTHDVLQRFYFSFAVLVPIWLCSALTHGPRLTRKSRSFSAAAGLMVLFLALSVSSSRLLRNSTLTLGMLCVLVQLSAALARGQQSALYLLAGDILTTGLRGLVLLLPSCSGILAESFPLYMLRCARIYDLPFTLGCLVFVSRRYALQFDRTEQLAQELDARVTQRTKALQDASDARKSMMLNIFHDLRSPLFVISSGLDTLEASPEALPALLPILQQRVRFVRGLTEDLFLAAKLEQKQVMLNEDRALLNVLTAAVCTACQTEADQKGVALKVSADCALPVWGDSMRLQQIVQNLVTNAIHYTPAGGQITVACAVQDGQARVSVTDTGCGIAPEDQAAVFDRYFHTTATTKHDSTGLGLTIAQELAHLHHGEITLQSAVGKGSCFTLCLPLLPPEE